MYLHRSFVYIDAGLSVTEADEWIMDSRHPLNKVKRMEKAGKRKCGKYWQAALVFKPDGSKMCVRSKKNCPEDSLGKAR